MYKINDRIIKVAIFDLDGTLLDSLGVWSDIDIKFLSKGIWKFLQIMRKTFQASVSNRLQNTQSNISI